ncbi:hypothetical protein BMF94_3929 [Rhodotorula taiwanensis]|uniref:FHA domain-containing protein n=1 Tax=Rhodotorula taiwanensis TaxID=741276 RepID=A0A2S5B8P7_9BASI|nr:hypothetical protein BMF94_3929 [Rhodotorula taiwanensis]
MSKPPPPPLQLHTGSHSSGVDGPSPASASSATTTPTPTAASQHAPREMSYNNPTASGPAGGPAASGSNANGGGGGNSNQPSAFPALHLTPLNGTFVPKQISLDAPAGARVKIGRQTNAKTVPNATNGYFDSKVLSRAHAEVWAEDGKVYIKDVKSSNGTFINGERLSPESTESDVFELHTDDIEFGIDILTDDTKQIVHHKVAAKVHLVLNAEDAIASHREINNWYRSAGEQSLNRARAPPRSVPAQTGLSFEHVLSRLQGELQKSRDTGANLTDVNSTLTQVHDTFSGGPAPSLPPGAGIPRGFSHPRGGSASPHSHQQQQQQQQQLQQQEAQAQSIAALQAQLNETQSSLQGHVGKIRELEGLLAEHDTIKREVGSLRAQMEEAQSSMSAIMRERTGPSPPSPGSTSERQRGATTNGRESPLAKMLEADEDEEEEDDEDDSDKEDELDVYGDDDDDDNRSTASVETVTESSSLGPTPESPLTRHMNGTKRGRSPFDGEDAPTSTPPPSSTPAQVDGGAASMSSSSRERLLEEQNSKLVARLEALSVELNEATQLGVALRSQHAEASQTIKVLEQRIEALEQAVDARVSEAEGKVLQQAEERWTSWRDRFEQSWKEERLSWEGEREALRRLVKDWEDRKRLEAEELDREAARDEGPDVEEREDDDEGSSGSEPDEDDVARSASLSPSSASPDPSPKKSRSSRRRKRSSLTPVPPSVSGSAASNARLSKLARHVVDGSLASDSDSTIGELGEHARGGFDGMRSGPASSGGSPRVKATEQGGLPLSIAGAVVVLAVAVGYGAAMKLKE